MKKTLILLSALFAGCLFGEAATFRAQVPEGTKKCYVCGSFNGWSADGAEEMTSAGGNLFTLELPEVTDAQVAGGFKYLCGQDWAYVEKDASGGEISNRTSTGDPDIVGSWAAVPEWDIDSFELTLNGIPRLVKVYVPQGYDESGVSYPVIYYNTVQQRFNDAGSDTDPGDFFFGSKSWNAHAVMEELRGTDGKAYVMVQVCSLLGENTPGHNPEFMGTGEAASWLKAFTEELMPYVSDHWRVAAGAASTTIVGADYGALFSLYAALERPDLFGTCVAMSPMLWVNEGTIEGLAAEAKPRTEAQEFYLSAGSLEPSWMISGVEALAEAMKGVENARVHHTLFAGASHEDESWGASFRNVLGAMASGGEPAPEVKLAGRRKAGAIDNFEAQVYTLYGGEDNNALEPVGRLLYTTDFRKKGTDTPVKAFVITNDIAASIKGKYYWNIACGADASDGWFYSSNKNIGFSSKKTELSWHNIAIFEDGSLANIAAHSKAFKVVTADGSTLMTRGEEHLSEATVKFPGKDKSFKINFGSVNSASDMGALTPSISVSERCVEAVITYDFNLNKVSVRETRFGDNLDNVTVTAFTASPAVCRAGVAVDIALELSAVCGVEISCTRDFTESVAVAPEKLGETSYSIRLADTREGIYTVSVSLVSGENRIDNAAEVNVRVLPAGESGRTTLAVNPYSFIDWATTGRYKSNFHTHTSQSFDTKFATSEVVDRYHNAGYSILALTDHDANSYPWSMFSLYNPQAEDRDPAALGMLAIPGIELSKDRRNSWSEKSGGEFNHHNDFFTGRKGQEFMSLRESYAYTQAIGGLQIINHPGQYWNLATEYQAGAKNSPEWHAENFRLYSSLIGLEVYNQGNRRPNDRILWDQILSMTMPARPVWGYSCDDTHTAEQYFRNYQFMLMPELSVDALKEAMAAGTTVFSYEYTGSGKALAPRINSITVDETAGTITVDTDDADTVEWIYSTHRTKASDPSSRRSTVVGMGKTFDYNGFQGSYVRARLVNKYGETATQPFGFENSGAMDVETVAAKTSALTLEYDSAAREVKATCSEGLERVSLVNAAGAVVKVVECGGATSVTIPAADLAVGVYIAVAATDRTAYTAKFTVR